MVPIKIEQDPNDDQTFFLTVSDRDLELEDINFVVPHSGKMNYPSVWAAKELMDDYFIDCQVKARVAIREAQEMKWVESNGGEVVVVGIRGSKDEAGFHWRMGLKITFEERDKAALFKMTFL